MTLDEAINFYGTKTALAKVLNISPAAVTQWSGQVPVLRQFELERITDGMLKADYENKYPNVGENNVTDENKSELPATVIPSNPAAE